MIVNDLNRIGRFQAGALTTAQGEVWHPANTMIEAADLLEAAWGIIANAYGGDWTKAHAEWREAAERWREKYHACTVQDAFASKAAAPGEETNRE